MCWKWTDAVVNPSISDQSDISTTVIRSYVKLSLSVHQNAKLQVLIFSAIFKE